MNKGSLVKTLADFTELSKIWNFEYPKQGSVLTVASAIPHHNVSCRKKGILLLTFEEYPNLVPISHKTVTDVYNFIEIIPTIEFYMTEKEVVAESV